MTDTAVSTAIPRNLTTPNGCLNLASPAVKATVAHIERALAADRGKLGSCLITQPRDLDL